jgi:hypothetical protein
MCLRQRFRLESDMYRQFLRSEDDAVRLDAASFNLCALMVASITSSRSASSVTSSPGPALAAS